MNHESIIPGITLVDESDHVVISHYDSHVPPGEEGVVVVEIANARLLHTRDSGNPDAHVLGRVAVFAREITQGELQKRKDDHVSDPDVYHAALLRSTAR